MTVTEVHHKDFQSYAGSLTESLDVEGIIEIPPDTHAVKTVILKAICWGWRHDNR